MKFRHLSAGYGLGWGLTDYRGRKLVSHTGGLAGMVSRVAMIPDLKLGVVVLTNQEAGAAFNAITFHVLDYYLSAPPTDWIGGFKAFVERTTAAGRTEEKKLEARTKPKSKVQRPMSNVRLIRGL